MTASAVTNIVGARRRRRRGSAYLLALFGSLALTILGLGTLMATHLELTSSVRLVEADEAALYARAGLDMALYRIDHDPDWRAKAHADTWDKPTSLGAGTYRIAFTDPVDGNVGNSNYDPIEIVATGTAGAARQKMRMRLDFDKPGLACLRSSIHAGNEVIFDGVTATTDHWVTANNRVKASDEAGFSSHVYADAAAEDSVEASGDSEFHGVTTTDGDWPLAMPDPDTVFDYYLANGTVIDVADIPTWDSNLLNNPGMEGPPPDPPTQHWFSVGTCAITADGTKPDEGDFALLASGRATGGAGPGQNVLGKVVSGLTYGVSFSVGTLTVNDVARITLTLSSLDDGVKTWSTPWMTVEKDKYKAVEGLLTPTWNGLATSATLHVETRDRTDDLRVDQAVLVEATPFGSVRTIHRQLLSPAHNPFGDGTANPEGIYVIDLEGGILSIQRSRIVGTLVVLNGHVYSWAVVHWAPAVSNFPALLSNNDINFWLGNEGKIALDEATTGMNYNPAGTPYGGVTDADTLDTYPALMRGIVYSATDVKLRYRPVLEGVVIAENNVISEATDIGGMTYFDVTYLSRAYREGPPGFRDTPSVSIAPGSMRRVVD